MNKNFECAIQKDNEYPLEKVFGIFEKYDLSKENIQREKLKKYDTKQFKATSFKTEEFKFDRKEANTR